VCEVVDASQCAERLLCYIGASSAGGMLDIDAPMYRDPGFRNERASISILMNRLPLVGETITWTPENGDGFDAIILQRYGDSPTFPFPITHAAGQARGSEGSGRPAYPAQGTVTIHVTSISNLGPVSGTLDAELPPVGGVGEPVTLHLGF